MSFDTSLWIIWVTLGVGLIAYVTTAGADFGAGLWDLLASGPRREQQREAVHHAIAPIWEANHIWLIFLIVLLFTVFPKASAAIAVALHLPILFALIGIVLRGAAFIFRAYGLRADPERRRWSQLFAWASAFTPLALGATLAALATGQIRVLDGAVTTGFTAGWTSSFALATGLFALVLFALLAAVYLAADTDGPLAQDFAHRAIAAEIAAAPLAALVAWRAAVDAPALWDNLAASPWTWPLQITTALAALATLAALLTRRYTLARYLAAAQVALVTLGWGLAMDGALVLPDLHIHNSGARPETLQTLLTALAIGVLLLLPALWLLYRIFKRPRALSDPQHPPA